MGERNDTDTNDGSADSANGNDDADYRTTTTRRPTTAFHCRFAALLSVRKRGVLTK